jgi:hemerythrin-like metal-binding protein
MALNWNDKYKIGDGKIDAEHQEWFRLANAFLAADCVQSMTASGEVFSQYTRQHFSEEEILMHQVQYPLMETHTREHQGLVSTLDKILDVVGEDVLTKVELEDFVGYCLAKHITTDDSRFALYIKRNPALRAM